MSNCSVKILPKMVADITENAILNLISGSQEGNISPVFNKNLKKPRYGFITDSAKKTDYGMKITYVQEKEILIQTFEGHKQEFQSIVAEIKFIKEQGILLISCNNRAVVDDAAKYFLNFLLADVVSECVELDIDREDLHKIIENGARTVIETIHIKTKGMDQIRMKAYDIQNKEWYIEEGFELEDVERYTFIPNLPNEFARTTVICKIYKNGRFVIYQKDSFGEKEIELIQFFIIKMITDILGSPLCKLFGQSGGQSKLLKETSP